MERVFCNDYLIREVATELGLSIETVRNMVKVQSEYTKLIIESNSFDFVRWPYLGIFKSKPKELQVLQYLQGMTPEQAAQFKKDVRTGKIKLWDKRKEKNGELQLQRTTGSNRNIQGQYREDEATIGG